MIHRKSLHGIPWTASIDSLRSLNSPCVGKGITGAPNHARTSPAIVRMLPIRKYTCLCNNQQPRNEVHSLTAAIKIQDNSANRQYSMAVNHPSHLNFGFSFDCNPRYRRVEKVIPFRQCNSQILLQTFSFQPTTFKRWRSTEPSTAYEHILASEPVHMAQHIFELGHSLTDLNWAGTIVATTLALRFVLTFPLSVYAQNIRGKVEALQPEIVARARYVFSQRFKHRMREEKWSEKRAQRVFLGLVRLQAKEIYVRENCHPAKGSLLLLVQLPLWITLSLALRNMSGALSERLFTDPQYLVPEFSTSGALWFPDLMAPDPFLALPIVVGLLNLVNIEMHALHKGRISRFQKGLNNFLRVFSVLMVPIAAYVPASLVLYWTTSAAYSFGQNVMLKIPSVRMALNIAKSKTDSSTPFRDMKEVFAQRYLGREKEGADEDEQLTEILKKIPESKSQKS